MGKTNKKLEAVKLEEKEFINIVNGVEKTLATSKNEIGKIITTDIKVSAKNDSQKKIFESIKNNVITICSGYAGSGKAQPLDSLILTENGFKTMSEIKLNDNIYSMTGNLTKVVGVFPQGLKDIYKVIFTDDSSTECCEEHLWLTKSSKERNYHSNYTIRQLKDMKDNLVTGNDKRRNYSIPVTNAINFNQQNISINPYIMGLLLGDGCFVAPNIRLTTNDDEIIDNVNKLIDKDYKLIKIPSGKYEYSFIKKDKQDSNIISYIDVISKYNLLGLKSDDKFIPNDYKFNSIDNRIELLQGLMDSDGTVEKSGHSLSYTSASNILINDFRFLIESLGGIVNKLRVKQGGYKKNGTYFKCKLSYTYSFRLPNNIIPFKLTRKLSILKKKAKYFPIRYIKDIKYMGKKEAQCIMVDDETHTYLTNNFIVTHNTYVALAAALNLLKKGGNSYKKIYLIKSVTPLKEESIGYLKGTMEEKMEPFMWSFNFNICKLISENTLKILNEKGYIKVLPLAYLRGTTLDDCIIILDECQNVTVDNAHTAMTRIGENCKLIILGDVDQVDLKLKKDSSLHVLINLFDDVEEIGTIKMSEADVNVRHPLIAKIEEKFKEHYKK
jgi:phosphate starvation-inducible protein PhoH